MSFFKIVLFHLLLIYTVQSQEITVKKSFWSGYQYSLDKVNFKPVGINGGGIRLLIQNIPAAKKEIQKYINKMTFSYTGGIIGGAMVGWSVGGYFGGGRWNNSFTILTAIGVPIIIVAYVLENKAGTNLLNAVEIYNNTLNADHGQGIFYKDLPHPLRIGLNFEF
jgi:hypothetical protein